MLAAAVTDSTFERMTLDNRPVWVGKCIHCNSKLVIADDGRALGEASLEHVWPQTRGGTNDVDNLAIACARCNREKSPHDSGKNDGLDAMVEMLRARRAERWRDPAEVGMAARLARVMPAPDD
jgi:hypothetical protein